MALQPLRWDNVGSNAVPQFTNSGYAVAGAAFGEVAQNSAALSKIWQAKEQERQKKESAAMLDAAVARMYKDGKATPDDLKDVPQGVSMVDLAKEYQSLGLYNTNQATDLAQAGAYNANAALTTAETEAYPDRIKREVAESLSRQTTNAATTSAAQARQNLAEFELAERTRISEERVALQTKTRAYEQAVTSGFRQEANDTFDEFVSKDGPPNPLLDTPEQREQFTTAKYNAKADSADEHRKIALENNLTLTEWAANPEAQRVLAIEQEGIARASERAAAAYDSDVTYQTGVDSYVGGAKGSAKYAGNEITFGKAGKEISKVQRTDLLNRYGLEESDNERLFTKLQAHYPDPSMYEYELERLVVPAGRNLLGFKKKGYKLVDGAEELLQTHIDALDSFANDIKNKRTTAYAGTSPEQAALNKAAADGSGGSGGSITTQESAIPGISSETALSNKQIIADIQRGTASTEVITENLEPTEAKKAVEANATNLNKKVEAIQSKIKDNVPEYIQKDPDAMKILNRMSKEFRERKSVITDPNFTGRKSVKLFEVDDLQKKVLEFDEFWTRIIRIAEEQTTINAKKAQKEADKKYANELIRNG